eukprot:TRINITY_DN22467_c0_g1_i1.p1 TRINITY_DN22467_c0_g1~~TRINITY_DN22467_c0_g1_i1.p1  ORF type:complete len:466 (+),score=36.12 TRINITY_DN22467_c0_g1_i1:76-1473(+)
MDRADLHRLVAGLPLSSLCNAGLWKLLDASAQMRVMSLFKAELHHEVVRRQAFDNGCGKAVSATKTSLFKMESALLQAVPKVGVRGLLEGGGAHEYAARMSSVVEDRVLVVEGAGIERCVAHKKPFADCLARRAYRPGRCVTPGGMVLLLPGDEGIAPFLDALPACLGAHCLNFVLGLSLYVAVTAVCRELRAWCGDPNAWHGIELILRASHLQRVGASWCNAFNLFSVWERLGSLSLDLNTAPDDLRLAANYLAATHCPRVRRRLVFSAFGGGAVVISKDGRIATAEVVTGTPVFTSAALPKDSLSGALYFEVAVAASRSSGSGGLCIGLCPEKSRPSVLQRSLLQVRDVPILVLSLNSGSWWFRGRKLDKDPVTLPANVLSAGGPAVGLCLSGTDVVVCVDGTVAGRYSGLGAKLFETEGNDATTNSGDSDILGVIDLLGCTEAARLTSGRPPMDFALSSPVA